jgi:FKBP-type peptidyl-prolyl cis-trans isomerase (trigger factor)
MKIDVQNVDDVNRRLTIEVPKELVNATFNDVYSDLSHRVKVKGFRKGKVPRKILEAQHGAVAKQEVLSKLIPEAYKEAIEQHDLSPVDYPSISKVDFNGGELTVEAEMQVKPEITLKSYKGLKIKNIKVEVSDKDLDNTLEYLKKGQGKGEDVAIDDDFARGVGYPNLDAFKSSLRRQMEMDKDREARSDVERQIIDQLIKQSKFTVPSVLIEKQKNHRIQELRREMRSHGMQDEDIDMRIEEADKELDVTVDREVRAFLIMDHIAKQEAMDVAENENVATKVMEFLKKEATWS